MNIKNRDDKKQKAYGDASASDAWSDVPAEVIPINTSFGVGSDDLEADVSEADIEDALAFGLEANDFVAAKETGAAMIKKWIEIASASGHKIDTVTAARGMNSVTDKVEPPAVATTGRPSVLKFPPPKEGIEAITTLLSVLTKRTEALDAQREEQIQQEKAANAALNEKLQHSEKVVTELQSSKMNIASERDQANLRHTNAMLALEQAAASRKLELEQAEQSRRSLEDQLQAAKVNIQSDKTAYEQSIKRAWVTSIVVALIIVAATIAIFKYFQ